VYAKLREQILNLELPPGTALSEQESALAFKVSRTPVRESFMRLAQEGLVEVLPQRGTFVSLIDTELVEEARFMREQLEAAVVRLACERFPKEALDALDANVREQRESMAQRDDRKLFELDAVSPHQDRLGQNRFAGVQPDAALFDDRHQGAHQVLIGPHTPGDAVHDDSDTVDRHDCLLTPGGLPSTEAKPLPAAAGHGAVLRCQAATRQSRLSSIQAYYPTGTGLHHNILSPPPRRPVSAWPAGPRRPATKTALPLFRKGGPVAA
ncbi:MAG: GntR family transcriptional regulator, partial [Firmicutes bacterium]|nr:GntR family transcriptional regulator [Bacillota bacterium]